MKITRETWAALYRLRTAHPCGNLLSHGTGSFGEKRRLAKSALQWELPNSSTSTFERGYPQKH